MSRAISDEQRIENFFMRESRGECERQRDRIDLIIRSRFQELQEPKRGRRAKAKAKPPIAADSQQPLPGEAVGREAKVPIRRDVS